MNNDIIIRGGPIVDGFLNPERLDDLAIDGDTTTAMGGVSGRGRQGCCRYPRIY